MNRETHVSEKHTRTRTWTWFSLASTALWAAALILGVVSFMTASEAARTSAHDGTFLQQILGAPFFEGFRVDGKFGVRPQWGLALLVVVPLFGSLAFTGLQIRRFMRGGRA